MNKVGIKISRKKPGMFYRRRQEYYELDGVELGRRK
jgi:hypothetical protein